MKQLDKFIFGIIVLLQFLCLTAFGGDSGFLASVSGMFLFNSATQGGQGPQGSTVLTQTDLIYHGNWWGIGGFFLYDMQGSTQTDTAVGPKIELHAGVFYLEFGYAPMMTRAFTDRTIARQTGYAMMGGLGVRFHLGMGGSSGSYKGFFLQSIYKYRMQVIQKQDGVDLTQPIQQVDGYPLFGVGYVF
jgi:hypothetical protein